MDISSSHSNLLELLGGVDNSGVYTLRVVDGMVGHSVSQVLRFMDYVRKHSTRLNTTCVVNILRLILLDTRYRHYPNLDHLIRGLIVGDDEERQQLSRGRSDLLARCLACEALRLWIREMKLKVGPNGLSQMKEREQAVVALVDSMEGDATWNSAVNTFATRLKEPVDSVVLQMQGTNKSGSSSSLLGVSGGINTVMDSGLSQSECQFMLDAMRTFSAFDHAAAATDMHVQKADELVPGRKRERGQGSSSDGNHPHDGLIPKKARAEDPQQQVSGKIEAGLEQEQIKLKKRLNDTVTKCASVRLQVEKVSSGRSGALSARQTGSAAAAIVKCLSAVSSLPSVAEQARCAATLSLWTASDDLLEATAVLLAANDETNSTAVLCFLCGAVLPKVRTLQAAASRVLVRAVETIARARVDLVVECVLARSLASWPIMAPQQAKACAAALGVEDSKLRDHAYTARKHALELVLRLGRSLNATVDSVIASACELNETGETIEQQQQQQQPRRQPAASRREVHVAQCLDAFLSPVAVYNNMLGTTKKFARAVKAPLKPFSLDLLLEKAWRASSSSSGEMALRPATLLVPNRAELNTELIKGLTSLVLVAPARGLGTPTLSALLSLLESCVTSQEGGKGGGADSSPTIKAISTLLSSLLSRYRTEMRQSGLMGRVKVLASGEAVAPHAAGVLRLLD